MRLYVYLCAGVTVFVCLSWCMHLVPTSIIQLFRFSRLQFYLDAVQQNALQTRPHTNWTHNKHDILSQSSKVERIQIEKSVFSDWTNCKRKLFNLIVWTCLDNLIVCWQTVYFLMQCVNSTMQRTITRLWMRQQLPNQNTLINGFLSQSADTQATNSWLLMRFGQQTRLERNTIRKDWEWERLGRKSKYTATH